MQDLDELASGGTEVEVGGAGAAAVEFLAGDVMTRHWREGDTEVVAVAKKRRPGKKPGKKRCPKASQTKKKK